LLLKESNKQTNKIVDICFHFMSICVELDAHQSEGTFVEQITPIQEKIISNHEMVTPWL
jgi:hypothetical protein